MKVVKLKCPECNANLEVNSDLENITCNYCGAKVTIEDENESRTERVIRRLGSELKKSRNYYSSDEYKERLNIQNEQTKKSLKLLGIVYGAIGVVVVIILLLVKIFGSNEVLNDDMTCTLNDKEYVIIMEKGEDISCASCDDDMLKEFNEKYLDKDDISLTKKNIRAFFTNNSGTCKG